MVIKPTIFKGYDIRAEIPKELDEEGMYQIGLALAHHFKPKSVAIGRDMRLTSNKLFEILTKTFTESGIDVVDLGLIATDMSYFASTILSNDLYIMITASHNPSEYNGLKLVTKGAIAVSGDTGIYDIRDLAIKEKLKPLPSKETGKITKDDILDRWIERVLTFVDPKKIKPLKVIIDAGNGMAGKIVPELTKHLPIKVTEMYFELDGSFPNHLAYPLIPSATEEIRKRIKEEDFDLGAAFDGDGDRVFLIDNEGEFVSGTVLTALVAEAMLKKHPGAKILYNAICGKIVPEIIEEYEGIPVRDRVGHSYIKETMRREDVLFGGEHSGHYFFKENSFADAGLIVFVIALSIFSESDEDTTDILRKYRKYLSSGEINFEVEEKQKMMDMLEEKYKNEADSIDHLDGISVWFENWWFNVRPSNTQPVLRLNIETDSNLNMEDKIEELSDFITKHGGTVYHK